MAILKWLVEKSEALSKKSLEFSVMGSFNSQIYLLERTHPEMSEEQRISITLYEILDNRYPKWDKQDKIFIINKYNSCVKLIEFLFKYWQMYGRTKDSFKGDPES